MSAGQDEIRKIISGRMAEYQSLLSACGGDVDKVIVTNTPFRDSVLAEIASNDVIINDPITNRVLIPNLSGAQTQKGIAFKAAGNPINVLGNRTVTIPDAHLNAIIFHARFDGMQAFELGNNPAGVCTDKDSRDSTLSVLFGLVMGSQLSTGADGITMVWSQSNGFVMPQGGNHRLLAHYLLGITDIPVKKCTII